MMSEFFRVSMVNLRRDRAAVLLSFVLPIVFFSVFAVLMPGGGSTLSPVEVVIADEDRSEASTALVAALTSEPALRAITERAGDDGPRLFTAEEALDRVRNGKTPIAVVIPSGFGETFGTSWGAGGAADGARVRIAADPTNPIGPQIVIGVLQKAAMTAAPDLLMGSGMKMFDRYIGMSAEQRERAAEAQEQWRALRAEPPDDAAGGREGEFVDGIVPVELVDLAAKDDRGPAVVAITASGTAVMFLLFMASGAAGVLLEDRERGVLDRLLSSRLTMGRLLAGHWAFITLMGTVQVSLMFVWGWALFGLELDSTKRLVGFLVVTVFTAAAAASFGLLLSAVCRSRAQQAGLATIVILVMSAVGGSMFPRFFMPDTVKLVGKTTFNGWALDAFYDVFVYSPPDESIAGLMVRIAPELAVMAGIGVVMIAVARRLARRWESA